MPGPVRKALHVEEDDEIEFTVTGSGDVILHGLTTISADQKWFWTAERPAGEREASEQIAAGDVTYFDSDEEFLNYLENGER